MAPLNSTTVTLVVYKTLGLKIFGIDFSRTYARVTENEPQRAQRSRRNESLRGFLRKSYLGMVETLHCNVSTKDLRLNPRVLSYIRGR